MDDRKSIFTTSDIEIKQRNTKEDAKETWSEEGILPGQYPYTRGIKANMYRSKLWTMRQYAGYGSAEESNKRYRYLLEQGQTGLSVAFDLPTQIGYDSDHPFATGEVGKVGVAIDTIEDLDRLFDGIPLDKVSVSMTINSTAPVLLAMYIVLAKRRGISAEKLTGTIQNDILKEYIARGTYIFPVEPSMRLITDIFRYCSVHMPKWNTISISGYHIREAGATAVQELAFTLADGIAYVQAALDAGLNVDDFAPRLSFFFNAHNNLFEEVAKFRAARRIWAKIMKERFGAKEERSMMLRFHTQTAGCTLTAQQPDNNIVRVAMQALAAVLGGTQSLHTNSRDEALALPAEDSVRIALRTQQILANEIGVADTADPLGGSYYVESLTDEMELRAMEYIDRIDRMGGVAKAIEKGYIQKEIQDSAYRFQRAIEDHRQIVVGVNAFQMEENRKEEGLLHLDPSLEINQKQRLSEFKAGRNTQMLGRALEELKAAAVSGENMMEAILFAVEHDATVGEICDILRAAFGEYSQSTYL